MGEGDARARVEGEGEIEGESEGGGWRVTVMRGGGTSPSSRRLSASEVPIPHKPLPTSAMASDP